MQNLHSENCKTSSILKEMKEDLNKRKDTRVPGLEGSVSLRFILHMLSYTSVYRFGTVPCQNPDWLLCRNGLATKHMSNNN